MRKKYIILLLFFSRCVPLEQLSFPKEKEKIPGKENLAVPRNIKNSYREVILSTLKKISSYVIFNQNVLPNNTEELEINLCNEYPTFIELAKKEEGIKKKLRDLYWENRNQTRNLDFFKIILGLI